MLVCRMLECTLTSGVREVLDRITNFCPGLALVSRLSSYSECEERGLLLCSLMTGGKYLGGGLVMRGAASCTGTTGGQEEALGGWRRAVDT